MAKQDVVVELFYLAVWNDHTGDALVRDGIEITHGRADESAQPAPSSAMLTFAGWRFNPRNPSSDLFGLIGRNTPIRISVGGAFRFWGEVSSWTPRQSLGGPNVPPDRWVQVEAAGLTRRLGQGADPLQDAMRREVEDHSAALVGYWPLDDADGSTQARSVLRGTAMKLSTEPELATFQKLPAFGAGALHPWLPAGFETRENGSLEAQVSGAVAGDFSVNFVYRATRASDGNIPLTTLVNGVTSTPHNFQVLLDPGLLPRIQVIDSDGTTLGVVEGDARPEIFDGLPHLFRLRVIDAAFTNVDVFLDLDGEPIVSGSVNIEQASLDPLARVVLFWDAGGIGVLPVRLGQVIAWNIPTTNMVDAFRGHAGEHAGDRVNRLTGEEGIPLVFVAAGPDDTQPCGPQYPDGLLAILREAADLDHAIMVERRTSGSLGYRPGRILYNQSAVLALDYDGGDVAPPLDPTLDDQQTRNDITVQRRDGDSVRVTLDTGRMSTQQPPDGVGRAQGSVTVNTMSDGLLGDHAGWALHLGTTDEIRFPQVSIDLDASPGLAVSAASLLPGDRITIANLPAELTPDLASLLIQGWTETIGSHRRRFVFNCTPEEPYHVSEVEHPDYSVIGSDGTKTDGPFEAGTETVMTCQVDLGHARPGWTVADGPFDILVDGVRLHVTDLALIDGFPRFFNFTVVQAPVNGVIKTVASGSKVDVFNKSYIGL